MTCLAAYHHYVAGCPHGVQRGQNNVAYIDTWQTFWVVRLLFQPVCQSLLDNQLSDNPGSRPGRSVTIVHISLQFL